MRRHGPEEASVSEVVDIALDPRARRAAGLDVWVVACNFRDGTSAVRTGAKAFIALPSGLPWNVQVVVRSRNGRWVRVWQRTRRLTNFRAVIVVAADPLLGRVHSEAIQVHPTRGSAVAWADQLQLTSRELATAHTVRDEAP